MRRRTNVMLDVELVEKAMKATGESTYSGAISRALEAIVRRDDFRRGVEELQKEAARDELWDRDYVTRRWPEVAEKLWPRQQRIADKAKGK